jgi:hypothetical protein
VTFLVLVAVGLTTAAVAIVAHALTGMPWAGSARPTIRLPVLCAAAPVFFPARSIRAVVALSL